MKRTLLLFVIFAASLATAQRPTPFGFKVGWSRSQVLSAVGGGKPLIEKDSIMVLNAAPGATNGFDTFTVAISRKGLSKVLATMNIATNRSGEQIQGKFSSIKSALVRKYGTPTKEFDFIHVGALWAEPEDFTMSLLKKERTLECYWKLADETTIIIEAGADARETGTINLSYEFHPEFDSYKDDQTQKEQTSY
jgi:hypothetical protein